MIETIESEYKYLFSEIVKCENTGYNNRYIHQDNLSKKLKPLHGKRCIYFLIDTDKIVYIGKSHNPYERIVFHRHNKEFKQYLIGVLKEPINQNRIESSLIRFHKPFYNLTDKINYRELKKVTLWLTKNQYEKLEELSSKEKIKKIEYLQKIINKKIKP